MHKEQEAQTRYEQADTLKQQKESEPGLICSGKFPSEPAGVCN